MAILILCTNEDGTNGELIGSFKEWAEKYPKIIESFQERTSPSISIGNDCVIDGCKGPIYETENESYIFFGLNENRPLSLCEKKNVTEWSLG